MTVKKDGIVAVDEGRYTAALEYDGNNNPIYLGFAIQGTAKSAPGWQIRRLTFDGNNNVTDIQYANGFDSYSFVWNDRTTYSYS